MWLAVPCGTRCWLPPWHLLFPVLLLFYPAVRTLSAVLHHRFCSTARSVARIHGGFIQDGARRGEGRRTGPLWLFIVTGNRAPRTRGEEPGAHPGRFGCFFHLNSDETLFYTVLRNKHGIFRAALSPPPAPQNFRSSNLVNWPPRQTDSQTATPPSPSPFHPLSSRPLSPPSQPLCSLPLIHFFASSCVTSIHPSLSLIHI